MSNPAVWEQYLKTEGEKPRRERNPKTTLKRGRRPRQVSDKAAIENARWAGIKEGMIYTLKKLDPDGPCCEFCGRKGDHNSLDADHIRARSQGGKNAAWNMRLLCRPCHQKRHGTVAFSSQGTDNVGEDK